jgi:hypothetical protein
MFCMVLLLVLSKVHRGLKELIGYQFKYVLKCKKHDRQTLIRSPIPQGELP